MKLSKFVLIATFIFFAHSAFAEELPPLPKGPLLLTSVTQEQMSAEYWINRLPNPDQVLKTPAELAKFNEEINETIPEQKNIFKWDPPAGKSIRDQIELEYNTVSGRKLFTADAKPIPKTLFENDIRPIDNFEDVPNKLNVRWGAATKATSVRALPTQIKMIEDPYDIEFDQLQYTLIKLWTPVAILHESKDGKWYYIQAPYVRGWVVSKDIAVFSSRSALKKAAKPDHFLVVTGESIPIYADANFENKIYRPSMGTILPLVHKNNGNFVISLPKRSVNGSVVFKKAYVKSSSDVSVGYPAFTQRNIIRQAFKLLGVRYGWGGMYDGRDCSGFTHDVFLSMGLGLPRDSFQQSIVGTPLGHFEPYKQEAEKNSIIHDFATPGVTIFKMPKHIMLYLGEENGHFYVIHSTWAERIGQDPIKDEKSRINQVVVTDLSLNGRSYLGSLFDRIIGINKLN